MRGWRIVIALAVATALLAWAYISLDRWQRRLIFHPNSYMVETPRDRSLAFSDQWIDVGDGNIHGWWIPGASAKAPAILFFHGNAGTISTELLHITRLHALGFAVLAVDYRGYGRSTATSPSEASVYADARAAWARLLQLSPDAPRHLLYGHSLGGAIAIDLASHVPNVDALVVEGTFPSIAALAETVFPSWWPMALLATQRFASDRKVESLHMPKLFIHCTDDEVIPAAMSEALYRVAPQPKAQLIIPGGSHNNCPSFAAAEWNQAMRRIGGSP
jgi:pimeloyl-ACP methyl ester carboxylesterase